MLKQDTTPSKSFSTFSFAYVVKDRDGKHTFVADLLTTKAELAPDASISICSWGTK